MSIFSVLSTIKKDGEFFYKGDSLEVDGEQAEALVLAGAICVPGEEPKEVSVEESTAATEGANTWGAQPDPVPATETVEETTTTTEETKVEEVVPATETGEGL